MIKRGKKYKEVAEKIVKGKVFSLPDGIKKLKEVGFTKFPGTFTANVLLGIDAEKTDQSVRGSVSLPHRFGALPRVVAIVKGEQAEVATRMGADFVGTDELIEKILSGWIDFEYMVTTPDLMGMVGKVAKILGPKGILPSKKNNTVALDVGPVIQELKNGLSFFKNDKSGQIHFVFGKQSLDDRALEENVSEFLRSLVSVRPSQAKGVFIRRCVLSTTMGPGVPVDVHMFLK